MYCQYFVNTIATFLAVWSILVAKILKRGTYLFTRVSRQKSLRVGTPLYVAYLTLPYIQKVPGSEIDEPNRFRRGRRCFSKGGGGEVAASEISIKFGDQPCGNWFKVWNWFKRQECGQECTCLQLCKNGDIQDEKHVIFLVWLQWHMMFTNSCQILLIDLFVGTHRLTVIPGWRPS